jgi:hypothetical protein
MSVTAKIVKSHSIAGVTIRESTDVSGDGSIYQNVSVAAGETGSLSVRTDDDTGVFEAGDSSHGITNGSRVDVYWNSGASSRRGMSVTGVSGLDITIDGGDGDALPAQDTAITVVVPDEIDVSVLGTNVKAIVLKTAARGHFVFVNSSDTEHLDVDLAAGKVYEWATGNGTDNPITGDQVDKMYLSHSGASAAAMQVGILYDN